MAQIDTLTLEDALRFSGPASFNLLIKPAGSRCNLLCRYCYYLDKLELYGGREPVMDEEDLERLIRTYLRDCATPDVTFNWHGGEPLLLGPGFFRKAVELQRRYADGKRVHNTLQTNGTLLTPEWADFFAREGFLLGVSVDGPSCVHDRYRKDRKGVSTLEKTLKGLTLLHEAGAEYNLLATVNRASEGRGKEVYRFLRSLGTPFIQFSPVVELIRKGPGGERIAAPGSSDAVRAPWSVSDTGFGRFLCDVFDDWVLSDVGTVFVNYFDATLACLCGVRPGICSFAETCGGNAAVEHNGDVYSCDHFVYPEFLLGNLYRQPLADMMQSPAQMAFGLKKREGLPKACRSCEWFGRCHGGCPKHRLYGAGNVLCEGYRLYFRHTAPYMEKMKELLEAGQAPSGIMPWARLRVRDARNGR
ncbi:MAG: anaerobic sulfatase maturase [Bacteroidales bacterium]|nr:anaerobic sulfatase maturase [Bacteroidales bacterium]